MPDARRAWLVSYDIAEPRRLARVARMMERHGIRLQYSVFLVLMNAEELAGLFEGLDTLIDSTDDDIRFYPIATIGRSDVQGASLAPPELLPHHEAFRQLRLPFGQNSIDAAAWTVTMP